MPDMPDIPDMPPMPDIPDIPPIPDIPDIPPMPDIPDIPPIPLICAMAVEAAKARPRASAILFIFIVKSPLSGFWWSCGNSRIV